MRLEISQPEGTPHVVELWAGQVVIGRDPECDLVLADSRCSRRHAIIEETPGGLLVRDAGSANGIYVNGRRTERSPLQPGDTVRLGATVLTVLEDVAETVVFTTDESLLSTDRAPAASSPASSPASPPSSADRRSPAPGLPGPSPAARATAGRATRDAGPPLTLTALAILWGLTAPASLALGVVVAARSEEVLSGGLALGAALLVASVGVLMALGLRARAPWARLLQIAAAVLGLFVCPFSFASVTVLLYMLRSDVRTTFEAGGAGAGEAEPTFALSLLGMLALGLVLTAAAVTALSPR